MKTSTRLNLEHLESRDLMAGNVSAWVSGSSLYVISADGYDNSVEIRQIAHDAFQVQGRHHGGLPTRVNNSTAPKTFYGVGDDIVVSLYGGKDAVSVIGQSNGRRSFIAGDLKVVMGEGDDSVYMNNLQVRGEVRVDTGAGKDWTSIDNIWSNLDTTIEDHAVWRSGDRDHVWVYNSNIGYAGYRANLKIDLNSGHDQVYLRNTTASYMNVKTYAGDDYISVESCKIWTHFGQFDGGPGRDALRARNTTPHPRGLASGIEVFS